MALRFLADHCISNSIVRTLRDVAHEVVRLKDVLPVESPDGLVIAKAQEIDAILLSMNGDFADIVTYPPRNQGHHWPANAQPCRDSGSNDGAARSLFEGAADDGALPREVVVG
jgi:hypothetical protein